MEKELQEYLREGEHVLWQGKPKTFQVMEDGSKTQILRKWILTVLIAGGLLACYLNYNQHPSMKFVAIVVVVAVVVLVSPFTEKSGLLKNRYWITDQRVILMNREKTMFHMDLSDIDSFQVVEGPAERPCIALGSGVFGDIKKQLRWRAGHPLVDAADQKEAGEAMGMILYGVNDVDAAAALLREAGCSMAV